MKTPFIALLMVMTYSIQALYLDRFRVDASLSLFYIPAGVITIATLVSPAAGPSGIFLGALIINLYIWPDISFPSILLLSLLPSFGAIVAVFALYGFKSKLEDVFRHDKELPEIDALDVFYFCSAYGVVNATAHQILFTNIAEFGVTPSIKRVFEMWFGDVTGSFLVFIAMNFGYIAWRKLKSPTRKDGL